MSSRAATGSNRNLTRNTLGGIVGNILEWYDFAVFGYFAPIIGEQFFPSTNRAASLLGACAVFAGAFFMRPLGGVLLGNLGDRLGRKRALQLSVLLMAVHANQALGGRADRIRAFTLDLGGGRDAAQAEQVMRALGLDQRWERVSASPADYDLEAAIRVIEDYHPLDVECAASSMCLLRGIRDRYPHLTYLLDGDGGDENMKSYPIEDSDLTLSSILRNPLLYQEGWGVDAIKHSLAYSGGLSRGYVRTYAPAAAQGFNAFSPYTTRSVIEAAVAIPFEQILAGDVS